MSQRKQVPTIVFIPRPPMAATVPYTQPQYDYRQTPPPAWTPDTEPKMHTENVTVKEG